MAQPPIPVQPVNTPMIGANGRVTPPWRQYFDLITKIANNIPAGGGAPADATYVVASANATLTAERVATDTTSIDVITAVAGQMSWERAALTGDVTATQNSNATTIANNAVTTVKILDAAVTYPKIQDVSAASRLLGRGSAAGAGDVQEITIGSGLTMSGTALSTSVAGGYPTYLTSVAITNTQFKALPTTFIEVVPAPGANKVLIFLFGVLYLQTAVAYTNVDTGTQQGLAIAYGDWAVDASNFYNFNAGGAGFLARVAPFHQIPDAAQLAAVYPDVTITTGSPNTPFKAIAWNNLGDYTGGDAANSYRVVTAYCIFDQTLGTLV